MATIYRLTRGDDKPITAQFVDEGGAVYALQGTDTVWFRIGPRGSGSPVLVKAATITDAPQGKVSVGFDSTDLTMVTGMYDGAFEIVNADGKVLTTFKVSIELVDLVAVNLLSNPSFESDLTGWTTGNLGGGTIAASTENKWHGAKSCKFTIPTQPANLYAQIHQAVAVADATPGDSVVLTAYILATALPDGEAGYLVRIQESKDGGSTFATLASSTEILTLNEWTRLSVSATVSTKVTHLRAIILARRGATMYVDAVQLEAGPRATPFRAG